MGSLAAADDPPAAAAPDTLNAQYARLRAAAAAPEPPPATGSVALARSVVESAQAFADYMQRASAVRPDYVDAAGVSRALQSGGVYEAGQLQEGAIAYVALAALQDRAFVQAIGDMGRNPEQRTSLGERLAADPRSVLQTPEASAAALRAARALGRLGGALYASGAAVKQSAYDIQHSAWSKAAVVEPEAVLDGIKARSRVREALSPDGGRAMLTSLVQLRQGGQDGGLGHLTPVVARGLTLAALAVLGEAGEEHGHRLSSLLAEAESAQCLKMARLNLYQCLSVAGPNYEDVFCLGEHAMMETARCVADASGWSPTATVPSTPAPPLVPQASILVPVDFGPEPSASAPEDARAPAETAHPQPPATTPAMQTASAGMG